MPFFSKINDLPETISLFPLEDALLLPQVNLPLHIFEPRYIRMVNDTLKTPERLIGIIQPTPTQKKDRKVNNVGCAGRIMDFRETTDGRFWITLSGICRFHYGEYLFTDNPYIKANIKWNIFTQDFQEIKHLEHFNRDQFMQILYKYLGIKKLSTDWENLKNADDCVLINALSIICPFSKDEKKLLLEALTLYDRAELLTKLIAFGIHDIENKRTLQ